MSANHDTSDVSPTSLNHLIGQENVVEQVRVALDAAQQDLFTVAAGHSVVHRAAIERRGKADSHVDQRAGHRAGPHPRHVKGDRHPVGGLDGPEPASARDPPSVQPAAVGRNLERIAPREVRRAPASGGR